MKGALKEPLAARLHDNLCTVKEVSSETNIAPKQAFEAHLVLRAGQEPR